MSKTVIKVEDVSKKFSRSLKHVMLYGVQDIGRNMFGIPSISDQLRNGEFWALSDVNVDVTKGEVLGIIGHNGSGKSTLLKLLNGIFMPDRGKIEITGRVTALIDLGAGFHPMLTGRENIYVNGSIIGMKKSEIDQKFDEIVDFAEIGSFIDSPVKHYSSGMYVRLGFAIAVHCMPDILLIDEILSVGDAPFRTKSMNKMHEIVTSGSTVCFVSHNIMGVEHICDRVMWIHQGRVKMIGETAAVLQQYMMHQRQNAVENLSSMHTASNETNLIWVTHCELIDDNHIPRSTLKYCDRLIIRAHYSTKAPTVRPYFMIYVNNFEHRAIFNANMLADGGEPEVLDGEGWLDVDFGNPPLYPGAYSVGVQIRQDSTTEHFRYRTVSTFNVAASPEDYGYKGQFKNVYMYGKGVALPYQYRWGTKDKATTESMR